MGGRFFKVRRTLGNRPAEVVGDHARIPLGVNAKGGYALVSLEDAGIAQHAWSRTKTGYAQARINGELVLMHRLVMGRPGQGEIDHINRDKVDNRRNNLRIVSHGDNMSNLPLASNNTSGVRGVDWDANRSKWRAQIQKSGKNMHLGRFDTIEEALSARLTAEAIHFNNDKSTREFQLA